MTDHRAPKTDRGPDRQPPGVETPGERRYADAEGSRSRRAPSAERRAPLLPLTRSVRPVPGASRPPILFVHGMLGGAWHFDWYQRLFAERGFPSTAIDLRGHWGSRPVADLGKVTIEEYVEDALEVAREMAQPIVVGHSMGGLIAQKLAEQGAARAAVLLCAAPPRGIPVASGLLVRKQLRHLGALLFGRPIVAARDEMDALVLHTIPPAERAALYERFVPESGRAGLQMSLGTVAVDARRVRCPVLVVGASEDRFLVPRIARSLARKYGAPYREFAGHGHFIVREPGWEGPAHAIADWLDGVLGTGGGAGA